MYIYFWVCLSFPSDRTFVGRNKSMRPSNGYV